MNAMTDSACRQRCQLVAALGGLLVLLLLMFVGQMPFITALFFGIMFAVLFGGFTVWAFCTGKGYDLPRTPRVPLTQPIAPVRTVEAVTPRPVAPMPAPAPAKPAPAPVASAVAAASQPESAAPQAAQLVSAPLAPVAAPAAPAAVKPEAKPKAKAASTKTATKAARTATEKPAPAPAKAKKAPAKDKPAAAVRASGLDAAMGRTKDAPAPKNAAPLLLSAPRDGKADNLKAIKGIGPKLETLLNQAGVWHFDQIASWKAKDIAFVDGKMTGFHGRITRDEWVKQARTLAKGGKTEFSDRVSRGEVY